MSKDKFWIAFSSIEQLDSVFIKKLYNHFGDIEQAFNASMSDLSKIEGLTVKKAEKFLELRDKTNPDKCLSEVTSRGLSYLTYDSENYPYLLKQIYDSPMILYAKGDIKRCNLDRTLAVVGSRRASTGAKESLKKIMSEFLNTDICIVSGLAAGIDTTAHELAIKNGLTTIGVIAGGLDFVYPNSNKELYKKIENTYGAVISEYYPTIEPLPFRFPQRNRIVTGLSYGTLVVEAAIKSGALISANLTLEQGRELMCIPGLITNPNTEGIYKLLKNGATMVTCADDILQALNWQINVAEQMKLDFSAFDKDEKNILNTIEIEPKSFESILQETKINADDLFVALTNLELSGVIKQIEGEKYSIA